VNESTYFSAYGSSTLKKALPALIHVDEDVTHIDIFYDMRAFGDPGCPSTWRMVLRGGNTSFMAFTAYMSCWVPLPSTTREAIFPIQVNDVLAKSQCLPAG